MASSSAFSLSLVVVVLLWLPTSLAADAYSHHDHWSAPLVSKEKRKTIASSDYGSVSAVDVSDGYKQLYHLQFFTLEPQSLLTPLYLHTDMVFYVHSGRGTIDWVGDGETKSVEVKRGDIYRIPAGSVFYVHSHPDPQRQKLRIHAIFTTPTSDSSGEQFARAYSNLADLIRGFDKQVLRMGFKVPEEVISALKRAERPPAIVPFIGGKPAGDGPGWKEGIFEALLGTGLPLGDDNKKKKDKKSKEKAFNILEAKPDVQNCNGQSIAVTAKEFSVLRGSDVGVFMVNLTKGSMVGPHWNPRATEVAVVTEGEGMVQVVLPTEKKASSPGEEGEEGACESWRVRVREGDVFVVPRYHAMAQMSFNDGSFSWVGFSTSVRRNRPQFLAGKRSVLQILDKDVLALALGVSNKTVEKLLAAQGEAVMLECTSCAEEAERTGEEEERQREEKEEEEKRRREEEEARKREEEEARKREEEERKRKEEEEERKREEEEEERKRKEEEEERKREEEEEERKREEEEEERKRKEEEEREEEKRREEEQERKRKEEEEREEERKRKEEEEERKRKEEEEREEEKRREEEQERKQKEEEEREEERKRKEEEEREEEKRREEEQERRKEEEEERKREEERGEEEEEEEREEEKRREEEEEERRNEEERREEEEEKEEKRRKEEEEEEREKRGGSGKREKRGVK